MPIPFPGTYDTLRRISCKGKPVSFGGFCEKCHSEDSYVFTNKKVPRGGILPGMDGTITYRILLIPIACCCECGHYARVLPRELLPRKTFGVRVIEKTFRSYLFSERSLRKAVTGVVLPAEHDPCHSTLSR